MPQARHHSDIEENEIDLLGWVLIFTKHIVISLPTNLLLE